MRVLTLLVRTGTAKYPKAESEIDAIFARQMPEVERTVIVADNALPPGVVESSGHRTVIGGDNSVSEFTAFDRALGHAGAGIWSYDLVHVVTEAFNTLYVDYLERFTTPLLSAIAGRPVCCGHIDCFNEPVEAVGFPMQHWIRSCFFFVTPGELKALGSLVSVRDRSRLFSGDPAAPFRRDAPVSLTYQRYITDWLTGADLGQGVKWHSSFTLGADTLPTFERKALSIVNEQLLSARLQALACNVVDVTWLSARLRERPAAAIEWQTPWRQQLAGRDRATLTLS